jgi:hypothetical protein
MRTGVYCAPPAGWKSASLAVKPSPHGYFFIFGTTNMTNRLIQFIALCMLGLFFLPYIWKLKQFDLLAILIMGMVLPIFDFITSRDKSK